MRVIGLGAALVVLVLGACSGEQLGGPQRDAGGSPPIGTTIDPPTVSPGADASTNPTDACWAASLPPDPPPILPTLLTVNACAAGTGSPAWSYPQDPAGGEADDRRYIVGRWQTCNGSLSMLPSHTAIEFGGNGRWRLLAAGASANSLDDTLLPLSGPMTSGYYSLLGSGQLNLTGEDTGGGGWGLFLFFVGTDTLEFTNDGNTPPVYARIAPSPLNGTDNPPPTAAGAARWSGTGTSRPAPARPPRCSPSTRPGTSWPGPNRRTSATGTRRTARTRCRPASSS